VPYFGLRSYTDGGKHYPGQIGSESTPQEWLDALLECTREWVRVLKPDGNLFVNLGDKYSGYTNGQGKGRNLGGGERGLAHVPDGPVSAPAVYGVPNKSLLGLPWRYALGCTDQLGLILRAEIIWAKPNGLPESVTDRVRRAHEQVFHFTRQPRYYAAVDEIREPHLEPDRKRADMFGGRTGANGVPHAGASIYSGPTNPLGKLPGSVWDIPSAPLVVPDWLGVDHFAAFPPALVRPVILGWSPPGICQQCGEGRRPIAAGERIRPGDVPGRAALNGEGAHGSDRRAGTHVLSLNRITGYACACPTPSAPTRPAVVLDPFGGTGTTALVASAYGRVGITVDLSHDYCRLATWRVHDPGERARARDMPKPPPVPDGMEPLFTM
jgi:DNA modification methylase